MLARAALLTFVLACVAIVAQHTNLGALLLGDACSESCPGDTAPHRCPPGCSGCACSHGAQLHCTALLVPLQVLVVARLERDETPRLLDAPPGPIFHVPRSLPA
jgi:hypothetical protein